MNNGKKIGVLASGCTGYSALLMPPFRAKVGRRIELRKIILLSFAFLKHVFKRNSDYISSAIISTFYIRKKVDCKELFRNLIGIVVVKSTDFA